MYHKLRIPDCRREPEAKWAKMFTVIMGGACWFVFFGFFPRVYYLIIHSQCFALLSFDSSNFEGLGQKRRQDRYSHPDKLQNYKNLFWIDADLETGCATWHESGCFPRVSPTGQALHRERETCQEVGIRVAMGESVLRVYTTWVPQLICTWAERQPRVWRWN